MNIEDLVIDEDITIIEAMKKLDKVAKKVLFVVKDKQLVASLSDGDVRRWILKQGDLEAHIKHAANYNPKFLTKEYKENATKFMKDNSIEAVPILDDNKEITNIIFWNEKEIAPEHNMINAPVVMMAGGLGTRLYPYTKILPKPLIPIGDIPIAEHIINQFNSYGCEEFFLVVNHKKNMIKAYFNEIEKEYTVEYADEERPLGTGGGLSLLKGKLNSTFILSNCDILIMEDIAKIYEYHKKEKNVITMVCSLKNYTVPYGVVEIGEEGSLKSMREKPQLSFFTNTGCYIVEPEVVNDLNENEVIGFPDIIDRYREQGRKVGVYPISENAWMDMGQMDEYEKMSKRLQ